MGFGSKAFIGAVADQVSTKLCRCPITPGGGGGICVWVDCA